VSRKRGSSESGRSESGRSETGRCKSGSRNSESSESGSNKSGNSENSSGRKSESRESGKCETGRSSRRDNCSSCGYSRSRRSSSDDIKISASNEDGGDSKSSERRFRARAVRIARTVTILRAASS
jgi:hypothetical protein